MEIEGQNPTAVGRTEQEGVDRLAEMAVEVGEALLVHGGEIHRVEDTVSRILYAYGAQDCQVFTIPSMILVTVRMPDGCCATLNRRISTSSNHMYRVEKLNALSREICRSRAPVDEVRRRVAEICREQPYPQWLRLIGGAIAAGTFAIFFGGNIRDCIAAGLAGIVIMLMNILRPAYINQMALTVVTAFLSGVMSIAAVRCGIGENVDMVLIGTVMLLIPGLALGSSLRDLLCGDTISGLLQMFQSFLLAIMLAFGYTLAFLLMGGVPV